MLDDCKRAVVHPIDYRCSYVTRIADAVHGVDVHSHSVDHSDSYTDVVHTAAVRRDRAVNLSEAVLHQNEAVDAHHHLWSHRVVRWLDGGLFGV